MNRSNAGFAICSVIAGLGVAAHADPVYVEVYGSDGNMGKGVAVSLSNGLSFWDGSTSKTLWAGQRSLSVDGEQVKAYSAELTSVIGDDWHEQLTAKDAMGEMKAAALDSVFGATDGGTFESADEAVAFQALLWEIVYDYDGSRDSLDLDSGKIAFGMVNAAIFADLKNNILRGGDEPMVDVLANEALGDHFRFGGMRIIPLPSAAGLAGMGLLGLGTRRRRA